MFDGASLAFDAAGEVVARGPEHERRRPRRGRAGGPRAASFAALESSDERAALGALVLGTRDYARRCGFSRALLGLSGGIDSALVACVAARALGPRNVLGVAMPSRYSSEGSRADAAALALDARHRVHDDLRSSRCSRRTSRRSRRALEAFAPPARPRRPSAAADLTAENLQARIRGAILMALSNRQGRLLLTTGNKSEIATGYCTLYGDMAGGLAVISDVAEDAGLPARARRERRARPSSPSRRSRSRRRPSCAPTRPIRTRCRPTTCSTRSSRPTSSRARTRRRSSPTGFDARRRRRRRAPRAHERVQAPPDAARPQDHGQGLRPRPPLSDRESLGGNAWSVPLSTLRSGRLLVWCAGSNAGGFECAL